MNLANRLTLLRFILLPLFILALAIEGYIAILFALIIFGFASITDLYDGWIARSRNVESAWGKFMDPLADKLLVISGFIYFVSFNLGIPAWMVVLIVVREFGVTGLRFVALFRGIVIPAAGEGKVKTLTQMITILIILLLLLLERGGLTVPGLLTRYGPVTLMSITLFLTVTSGLSYIFRHKELIFPVK